MRLDRPDCATQPYWIIKDEQTFIGRAQLGVLLATQAASKSVKIVGYGTCDRIPVGEDIKLVITRNG